MMKTWKKVLLFALMLSLLAGLAAPVVAAEGDTAAEAEEYVFPEFSDPVDLGEVLAGEITVTEHAAVYNHEGKDYLLTPAKGQNLYIFKLTDYLQGNEAGGTWIYDTEGTGISTPRCIIGDGNGTFYICGDANYVYAYDFNQKAGYKIRIPSQRNAASGLALDGEGNLYVTCTPDAGNLPAQIIKVDLNNENKSSVLYETMDVKAFGNMAVADGYVYSCGTNRSGKGSQIHKVDLKTGAFAGAYQMPNTNVGLYYVSYIDGVLIGGHSVEVADGAIAVDTKTMTGIDIGVDNWIMGVATTPTAEGKSYFVVKGKGVHEYDIATRKATMIPDLIAIGINMRIRDAYINDVNFEGITGKAMLSVSASGAMPYLMSLEGKGFVTLEEMMEEAIAPAATRSIVSGIPGVIVHRKYNDGTVDREGAEVAVYVGGYLCGRVASYSPTLDDDMRINSNVFNVGNAQTDSMITYKGKIYGGSYTGAHLFEYDPATDTFTELINNKLYDEYGQLRLHGLAAGDDKIFFSTIPDSGKLGGSLGWYDLKTGDYKCFPHIVPDQAILGLAYDEERDLLFACSSCKGGSGSIMTQKEAMMVVYDVANDKHLGNFSIRSSENPNSDMVFDLENGDALPMYIAGIGRDPDTGKLWGLVCNTLFSFDYDVATGAFSVHEEWSGGGNDKASYPEGGSLAWFPRPFCFDGKGNLILTTYDAMRRFSTADPSDNSVVGPSSRLYAIGTDGNIYYLNGENLCTVATSRVGIVKALIDGSEPADRDRIWEARVAYEALTAEEKTEVSEKYLEKLAALEGASKIFLDVAVERMEKTINEIGVITAATSSYNELQAARRMYENLYEDAKPLVSNYDKLLAFEEAYATISAKTQWSAPTAVNFSFEPRDLNVAGYTLQEVTFDHTANKWAYACGCDETHGGKFNAGAWIQVVVGEDGARYLGIQVKIPAAGLYDITVRTRANANGSMGAVYMFPMAGTPIYQLYQDIDAEVKQCSGKTEHYIGSVDYKLDGSQMAGQWDCQEAGDYILCLGALNHPDNKGYASLYGVDMTYTNPVIDSSVAMAASRINAIGKVTKKSGNAIDEARITFDALTDAQKELIYAPQLEEAEKTYADVLANDTSEADDAAIALVELQIKAIGKVGVGSGPAIEMARQAYDALESRLQKEVSNYKDLVKAESDYAALTAPTDTDDGNVVTVVIIIVAAVLVVAGVVVAIVLAGKKKKNAPANEEAPSAEEILDN